MRHTPSSCELEHCADCDICENDDQLYRMGNIYMPEIPAVVLCSICRDRRARISAPLERRGLLRIVK